MDSVQYTFKYEDVTGTFGRRDDCFILTLKPKEEDALHLWHKEKENSYGYTATCPYACIVLLCGSDMD